MIEHYAEVILNVAFKLFLAAWLLVCAGAVLVFVYIVASVLIVNAARAHEAQSGWAYDASCCSGVDCREVPDAAVVEGARGYEIVATGELLIWRDVRIRYSKDGKFHRCSVMGGEQSRTLCLYVPARGS